MLALVLTLSAAAAHGLRLPAPRTRALAMGSLAGDLSLGAPQSRPEDGHYLSAAGVRVDFAVSALDSPQSALDGLVARLDSELGLLLSSSYEVGDPATVDAHHLTRHRFRVATPDGAWGS